MKRKKRKIVVRQFRTKRFVVVRHEVVDGAVRIISMTLTAGRND